MRSTFSLADFFIILFVAAVFVTGIYVLIKFMQSKDF
jgi:hypothetical protein